MKKRLLILTHFNKHNALSEYVVYMVSQLRPVFTDIIFISNSLLHQIDADRITPNCDKLIIRHNEGFDFGAWRDAMLDIGFKKIAEYDSLTLINDSCFGPLNNLEPIFEKMEQAAVDFWGISNSVGEHKNKIFNLFAVPTHIQSYFLTFNKTVLNGKAFASYWNKVKNCTTITDVIKKYETKLTRTFQKLGYRFDVVIDAKKATDPLLVHLNIPHSQPLYMIENGSPFIKIKSFPLSAYPRIIKNQISHCSTYPIALIDQHFDQTFLPDISLCVNAKSLISLNVNVDNPRITKNNVAIHVHVGNMGSAAQYLPLFKTTNCDIFITFPSADILAEITQCVAQFADSAAVRLVPSKSTHHIGAWLEINQNLSTYEFVGHFHTGQTGTFPQTIAESYQQESSKCLLAYYPEICKAFRENSRLGIIIPDMQPDIFKFNLFSDIDWKNLQMIWEKSAIQKAMPLPADLPSIASISGNFWYSTAIFQRTGLPAMASGLVSENHYNTTDEFLALIQKTLIYLNWGHGYDFKIAAWPINNYNSFEIHDLIRKHETLQREIEQLRQSTTFNIGRLIMTPLLKINEFIKSIIAKKP